MNTGDRVREYMRRTSSPVTVSQVAENTGINRNTIRGLMVRLVQAGQMKRIRRGTYQKST